MIFNFKAEYFNTEVINGIHYLYTDSTMFGEELKFGDLSIYSLLLFCIKSQLIMKYPKRFNKDNLFFIMNNNGSCIKDIEIVLKYFTV